MTCNEYDIKSKCTWSEFDNIDSRPNIRQPHTKSTGDFSFHSQIVAFTNDQWTCAFVENCLVHIN